MKFDCLVVGAGFAGSVVAERLAIRLNKKVLLVEKRGHVGGNSFDQLQDDIFVQPYGPHIFHTNSKRVWDYLSRFTAWNDYEHRVLAFVTDRLVSLPISLVTLEQLYGRQFGALEMESFMAERRVHCPSIQNSRDVIISQVGVDLYELFFKNYTKKQWGVYPEELDAEVTKRLPVRFDRDTRYFTDIYQGLPKSGFAAMFRKMLDHPNIRVLLNTDYREVLRDFQYDQLVYTGPIDEFFDCKYGKLPYRSLDFRFESHGRETFQPAGVVNYPNDHDFTRITEFKWFYQQNGLGHTTVCYEYPTNHGEPYYPIPCQDARRLYERYNAEADALSNVHFVGRLAQYRYLNMDQVVESALNLADSLAVLQKQAG